MLKHLLSISILLGSFWASAQSLEVTEVEIINDKRQQRTVVQSKGLNCGPDTVQYGFAKTTALTVIGINNATSAGAACQYFDCPDPMLIEGATFFAWKPDETGGITQNVQVQVYLAGADSLPTGSPIASVDVTVDTTFGGGSLSVLERAGNFTPVLVSQPYCMVVRNESAIGISMVMSDYEAFDGQQEWLGGALIGATWLNGYDIALGPNVIFDADVLIQPIVSYSFNAGFELTGLNCVPEDGAAQWNNSSSVLNFNRMYSVAAFLEIDEVQFSWDYGDGSPLENTIDGMHTYSGAPSWTVTLTDSLFGWTTTCIDSYSESTGEPVSGVDIAIPGNGSGIQTFNFVGIANGSNITSWAWDFGDGNTSNMQNPTHTYAIPGNYTVCLTATNDCGSDQYCGNANANTVTGILELIENSLSMYPNPSNGNVTIEMIGSETLGQINILDLSGRAVYSESVLFAADFRKDLDFDLNRGVYILQMITSEGQVSRKLNIQ